MKDPKTIVYEYEKKDDVLVKNIQELLDYVFSISYPKPEKSFTEMCKDIKEEAIKQGRGEDVNFRIHYGKFMWPVDFFYLPDNVLKEVWENRKETHNIENYWDDYIGILKDFLFKGGGFKEVYGPTDWSKEPLRHCEDVPTLDKFIGEENAKKVEEVIDDYKHTYKYNNRDLMQYAWAYLSTPSCNKEKVVEAWKELGKDIELPDDSWWKSNYEIMDEEDEYFENDYSEDEETEDLES